MAIFNRNGTWWIDFYYQGKRHRQKIGSTKRKAEEAYSQIKVKIAAGDFVPIEERKIQEASVPKPISFEVFVTEEFLPWSQMQHSAKHYTRLEGAIRNHLVPYMGNRHLQEITTKQIEDYKSMRHRRGKYKRGSKVKSISEATINRELCAIKVILRKAAEWGHISESPARGVKTFKEQPQAPKLLEQEEVARLLEATPEHLKALVSCIIYAGLRRDELFHLRWEDVNWRTGELTVASRREHHTKNYQSRRIPMNAALVEALRSHPRHITSPHVFCNSNGKPYTDVRDSINNAARDARIQGQVKLHQLRHAFCSHALMQGIDPRTVQKWMGHKTLQTTLRYAHVSPDHEKAAIQRLSYNEASETSISSML
jgi:integrase